MKLFVGFLVALFIGTQVSENVIYVVQSKNKIELCSFPQGSVILQPVSSLLASPELLFVNAWEYQSKLTSLQQDINLQLIAIRTSVSNVLRSSSTQTLEQTERNAVSIWSQDAPVRDIVFALENTACTYNIKSILNKVTEYSGFPSSNCIARYDKSVQAELKAAYALLEKYEGLFSEIQQIVVKSFIQENIFLTSQAIILKFQSQLKTSIEDWEKTRFNIASFIQSLTTNVAVFNTVLESCYNDVQLNLVPSYNLVLAEVSICKEFDNARNPFVMFQVLNEDNFLKLENVLSLT